MVIDAVNEIFVTCMLCDADDATPVLNKDGHTLVRCNKCGLVFLNPRPAAGEMDRLYDQEFYNRGTNTSFINRVFAKLLRILQVRKICSLKRCGRVLDIGCGTGEFLADIQRAGWEVCGVETAKAGFNLARSRLGPNVHGSELGSCNFLAQFFDVITLWHVLEHVSDPLTLLEEIKRILKNDGILVLSVPNIESVESKLAGEEWFHLDLPRHLCHYSPQTIKRILEKAGFGVYRVNHFSPEYKQVLLYSIASYIKRRGKLSIRWEGMRIWPQISQMLLLAFVPFGLILSYLFASVGRSGTIEVYARKMT